MRKTRLKKHLDQLGEDELRSEIMHLFEQSKEVKAYYTMELGSASEREKKYQEAKEKIASKFISRSRRKVRRPRINPAKKILRELEGTAIFKHELIDVYLFSVEKALVFGEAYHYSSDPLYNFIRQCYEKAHGICQEFQLLEDYQARMDQIIRNLPVDLDLNVGGE